MGALVPLDLRDLKVLVVLRGPSATLAQLAIPGLMVTMVPQEKMARQVLQDQREVLAPKDQPVRMARMDRADPSARRD